MFPALTFGFSIRTTLIRSCTQSYQIQFEIAGLAFDFRLHKSRRNPIHHRRSHHRRPETTSLFGFSIASEIDVVNVTKIVGRSAKAFGVGEFERAVF